jgi:hypothetical protein
MAVFARSAAAGGFLTTLAVVMLATAAGAQSTAATRTVAPVLSPVQASASRVGLAGRHVPQVVVTGQAKRVSDLDPATPLKVVINLPLRNEAELDQLLWQLQERTGPLYHKYLSVAETTARFAPTPGEYAAVIAFAKSNGLTVTMTPVSRRLVSVTGTVAAINKAFSVTMGVYQHPTEARTFFSPDREPTVPAGLQVLQVTGMNNYVLPHSRVRQDAARSKAAIAKISGSGPGNTYLPSDMRAAYYGGTALTGAGQTIGIFSYEGYQASDIALFYSEIGTSQPVPITNVLVDGFNGRCNGCEDTEQTLDIEQSSGMAPGAELVLFYESDDDTTNLSQMQTDNKAKVLSCSWGWSPEDETSDDPIFKLMAVQGQTFLNATGDDGAYNAETWDYPSGDPYIVQVGGTDLETNGAGGSWKSETGWPYSGGGIAPLDAPIPAWQSLSGVITSTNRGSTSYRNDPDVAAEADFDNFTCQDGGCSGDYGGTSFAAPRWAGFFTLVNQQSVADGNSWIGFPDPQLYSLGLGANYDSNFHDITSGFNPPSEGGGRGFEAGTGYDLVTGWGSPNGATLIDSLATPLLVIAPTSGSTATSFSASINYPQYEGTATFYAAGAGAPKQVGTCTVSASSLSTCSSSFNGSAIGPGPANITVALTWPTTPGSSTTQTETSAPTGIVIQDATSLAASANPATLSSGSTTVTATLTDSITASFKPTGSVSFSLGTTPLGSCTLNTGSCSITVNSSALAVGPNTISASYSGVVNSYTASSGSTIVTLTTAPNLTFTSVNHNFGSIAVNTSTSGNMNFGVKLTNGSSNAFPFALTLSGSTEFSQANNCGSSVAANSSCEIIFIFAPTVTGTQTANWSLATHTGFVFGPSDGGTLTGTGVRSGGVFLANAGYNFGTVADGSTSAVYSNVLTNSTASPVTLAFTTVTAPYSVVENTCPASLLSGSSCDLQFEFSPTASGTTLQKFGITANGGALNITAGGVGPSGVTVTGITLSGTGQ